MKKINILFTAMIGAAILFTSCGKKVNAMPEFYDDGKTSVERYGHLKVIGTALCDERGNPVQLRGMSSHGLQWYGKYANENVMRTLRDDWKCDMWRAALYLSNGGYIGNPQLKSKVIESIDAAIELGMYVLVDWHVLSDRDPLMYMKDAEAFFDEISSKYPDCPNIIYEICNEPNGKEVTWNDNIRPYAEKIIPVIRKNSPKSIIVVGTPRWSSDLKPVMKNPLKEFDNVMYTVHFYCGSHGKGRRAEMKKAMRKGLALFVTEWGTTKESGDGGVFEKETLEWMTFLGRNKISWANWSVNNKGEDSGVLKFNADRNATGDWKESDLSKSGIFVRKILRGEIEY